MGGGDIHPSEMCKEEDPPYLSGVVAKPCSNEEGNEGRVAGKTWKQELRI